MKKFFIILFIGTAFFYFGKFTVSASNIYSGSGILMDMDTKQVIYQRNIHHRYLTASIAKIMTCIIAIEEKPLDMIVTIDKTDNLAEGSGIYLKEGDQVYLKDLLYGLMLRSGNDAASAISRAVGETTDEFVRLMNKKAKEIGMKNSEFGNPSGLDSESKNYSTSFDMALLMSYAFNNPFFREINNTPLHVFTTLGTNTKYYFYNKHKLISLKSIYNGGKTGYTKLAGRTLVTTASKNGINLVVVTFKGSKGDFQEHQGLFDSGFKRFQKKLYAKESIIKVREEGIVSLKEIKEDVYVTLSNNEKHSLTSSYVRTKDGLFLCIYDNGKLIHQVELFDYDIEKADNHAFFRYIRGIFYDK